MEGRTVGADHDDTNSKELDAAMQHGERGEATEGASSAVREKLGGDSEYYTVLARRSSGLAASGAASGATDEPLSSEDTMLNPTVLTTLESDSGRA